MANGVRRLVVSTATATLMFASTLGAQGSAAAAPQVARTAVDAAVVSNQLDAPEAQRHCRSVWHRGYWEWVPRRYWDGRHHRWVNRNGGDRRHRWIKVWHRAGWTRVCR